MRYSYQINIYKFLSLSYLLHLSTQISGLSTLEIKMRRWDENYETRDFSEDEMSLFKQALLVMDKMDRVTIAGLDVSR